MYSVRASLYYWKQRQCAILSFARSLVETAKLHSGDEEKPPSLLLKRLTFTSKATSLFTVSTRYIIYVVNARTRGTSYDTARLKVCSSRMQFLIIKPLPSVDCIPITFRKGLSASKAHELRPIGGVSCHSLLVSSTAVCDRAGSP